MSEQNENHFDVTKSVKSILGTIDREREQDVIARRFGINGRKETLEQVGESLGITRERVRQIEKATLIRLRVKLSDGKSPVFDAAEKEIIKTLSEMGRAARITDLTEKLTGSRGDTKLAAGVTFLAALSQKLVSLAENDKYYQGVAIAKTEHADDRELKEEIEAIVSTIKEHGQPLSLNELHALTDYEHPAQVAALASLSKKVATLHGKWGLINWPTVNPKNIRDKIFVVMEQNGKPMHFGDIAKTIKDSDFKRNNVTQQAIHNELIKDDRFVLVGRGIYALDSWGFKKGTIVDIITDVLRAESPLHREEIVKRVLKDRQVREATILLNLQNKPQFKRVAKAQYALDEELAAEAAKKVDGRKTRGGKK